MNGRWTRGTLTLGSDGLALLGLLPLLLVVALVPLPLVLPAFALASFAGAGLVAYVAWKRNVRRHLPAVTLWDIAGALVLLGCAAGIFGTPENAVALFVGS